MRGISERHPLHGGRCAVGIAVHCSGITGQCVGIMELVPGCGSEAIQVSHAPAQHLGTVTGGRKMPKVGKKTFRSVRKAKAAAAKTGKKVTYTKPASAYKK